MAFVYADNSPQFRELLGRIMNDGFMAAHTKFPSFEGFRYSSRTPTSPKPSDRGAPYQIPHRGRRPQDLLFHKQSDLSAGQWTAQ